jgi:hypothetical protein
VDVERSGYIVRLGVDTIMAESFSASPGRIEGDIVDRSPTTSVLHYQLLVDGGGRIARARATQHAATGASLYDVTIERALNGFDVVIREGDSTQRRHVAAPPEAVPLLARSIGLYEVVTARLRHAGVDSISVPILDPYDLSVTERVVRRLGEDSLLLTLYFPRGEHARVDRAGHILGVSGLATSYKWLTERAADVDIAALTRAFAARDAKGASLGNYSLRDTVRAMIDGARITIDYGRPAKRGRVIFGDLVPWRAVWRTGADLATHFTTDRALQLNGLLVPAGIYTLYTLPSPAGWQLIVNRQTGQLGLIYNAASDLGRVPMTVTEVPSVTERLTIAVTPSAGSGGVLRLAWDRLVAEVPFTVAAGSQH